MWTRGAKAKDPSVLPRPAFDVSLQQTLLGPRSPLNYEKIGAGFVYPPWGSFVGHISGPLEASATVIGTVPVSRQAHGPLQGGPTHVSGKWDLFACAKGTPQWSQDVVLPKDLAKLRWRARPAQWQEGGKVGAQPKRKR